MSLAETSPLPDQAARVVRVRAAVEKLFPGSFDRMPYTARVFAENIVRKGGAQDVKAALEHQSSAQKPLKAVA